MNLRAKTLILAGLFLLCAGQARPLRAQTNVEVARTYTGTAIQTTASGQSATGTFALYVRTDGGVFAKIVLNGVVSGYGGELAGFDYLAPKTKGAASVSMPQPYTLVNGRPVYGPKQPKIPLYIRAVEVYGGILNADGSSLLFHGDPGPYPDPIVLPAAVTDRAPTL